MRRPVISTNLAISADGKISSSPPRPSGWTSAADHQRLLDLRKNADALMVGRGTLEADQMTLTVPNRSRQPLRCVVSRRGQFNFQHPLFHRPGGEIHLLVTGEADLSESSAGNFTLHRQSMLQFLHHLAADLEVAQLHCEGGGELIQALAALDVIDEFHLTLAGHTLFGGQYAPTTTGIPAEFLPQTLRFALSEYCQVPETGECFLTYRRSL